MENVTKFCIICNHDVDIDNFQFCMPGIRRNQCKFCYSKLRAEKQKIDRQDPNKNKHINKVRRDRRSNILYRSVIILEDSKTSDRKVNFLKSTLHNTFPMSSAK